jgi:hypothetical protein
VWLTKEEFDNLANPFTNTIAKGFWCDALPQYKCPESHKLYYLKEVPLIFQINYGATEISGNLFCTGTFMMPDGTEVDIGDGAGEVAFSYIPPGKMSADLSISCSMYVVNTANHKVPYVGWVGIWANLVAEPLELGEQLVPERENREPFELSLEGPGFTVLSAEAPECSGAPEPV